MTAEEKAELEKHLLGDCKAKEGGTDADVELMVKREHPTTHTGKCMSACIAEAIGVVSTFR